MSVEPQDLSAERLVEVFRNPDFLAARKWRHSDAWREAYYAIRAGHTDRDAHAMYVYAQSRLGHQRGLVGYLRQQLEAAEQEAERLRKALISLYTFPAVKEVLAPSGSLGSIRDEVDAALAQPPELAK